MVTKNDYISLLNSPSLINSSHIIKLEELQAKYPYSGDIQMLLAKGYHQANSVNYQEQLKNTAISIPNREALYDLIYKIKLNEKIQKEETFESVEEEVELKPKEEEIIEIISKEKPILDEIVIKKENTNDKLEELILSHAIGASYVLEEKGEATKENNKKEVEEKKSQVKQSKTEHHSFYSWLTPIELTNEIEEESENNSIDSLVEKFIESQGNDKIKRKEFFSPTNVAKLSIVETDDFVTETLADIYFKQHMYDKALRAYEKLILKNPEKKTYFAGQIKKIKSLLE